MIGLGPDGMDGVLTGAAREWICIRDPSGSLFGFVAPPMNFVATIESGAELREVQEREDQVYRLQRDAWRVLENAVNLASTGPSIITAPLDSQEKSGATGGN